MDFPAKFNMHLYRYRQIFVEGHQRQHSKEFLQFLSIASGSLAELETHIYIAGRLGYVDEKHLNNLLDKTSEIGRMVNGLRRSIKKKIKC